MPIVLYRNFELLDFTCPAIVAVNWLASCGTGHDGQTVGNGRAMCGLARSVTGAICGADHLFSAGHSVNTTNGDQTLHLR